VTDRTVEIVLHVPKCAGTTVERHLERHLGAHFWSTRRRRPGMPSELMGRKYAGPAMPTGLYRAVSGHWVGRSVAALFAPRPVRVSVLLRDPAALVLSWYNYRMMRYRAAGRRPYGFGLHLASLPADPMAHFLLERWLELPWTALATMGRAEKRARLDAALGAMDFVGDISDCDRLVARLSRRLGLPERAEARNTRDGWQRRDGDWRALGPDDLSPGERAALARHVALDAYLWRRWALGEGEAEPAAGRGFLGSEAARAGAELRRRLHRMGDRPVDPETGFPR
jgi:hypothetical protein